MSGNRHTHTLKICVLGHPGLGTDDLVKRLYDLTPSEQRQGPLISMSASGGPIGHAMFTYSMGMQSFVNRLIDIHVSVASVPTAPHLVHSRSLICRSMDGLLFLLDTAPDKTNLNQQAWELGVQILHSQGRDINSIPLGLILVGKSRNLSTTPTSDEEIATLLGISHEDSPAKLEGRTPETIINAMIPGDTDPALSTVNDLTDQILKALIARLDNFDGLLGKLDDATKSFTDTASRILEDTPQSHLQFESLEPPPEAKDLDRKEILAPLDTVFLPDSIVDEAALALGLAELLEGESPIGSGCILNGPPGTGKTELLRSVAQVYLNAGAYAHECHLAEMAQRYVGALAHNLEQVFQAVVARIDKYRKPALLYFDEATTLVSRPHEDSTVKMYYQSGIDVMKKYIGNYPGLVVGISTNAEKDEFDEALIRAGRLDVIKIDRPDREQRSRMWQFFLDRNSNMQITTEQADQLADDWVKATGAAVEIFCRKLKRMLLMAELKHRGSRNLIAALKEGPLLKESEIEHLMTFEQIRERLRDFAKKRESEDEPRKQAGFRPSID